MSNLILCKKLNKELPALEVPPMPGPKGIEIMNSVSAEAWEMWKSHQTTLINEKHLDMSDAENRKWLLVQSLSFYPNLFHLLRPLLNLNYLPFQLHTTLVYHRLLNHLFLF